MSSSNSKSSPNLVADELVLDAGDELMRQHQRVIKQVGDKVMKAWQKRNQANRGEALAWNMFHYGLDGIRPMVEINPLPEGSGDIGGRGEGSDYKDPIWGVGGLSKSMTSQTVGRAYRGVGTNG